jgi:hypothetical protein
LAVGSIRSTSGFVTPRIIVKAEASRRVTADADRIVKPEANRTIKP